MKRQKLRLISSIPEILQVVQENQALAVERKAEAENKKEQALLNFVKALKEIESVDLDHVAKLLALSDTMQQKEQMQQTKDDIAEVNRQSLLQRVQEQLQRKPQENAIPQQEAVGS